MKTLETEIVKCKKKKECNHIGEYSICYNQLYQRCFHYLKVNNQLPIKPLGERRWNQL